MLPVLLVVGLVSLVALTTKNATRSITISPPPPKVVSGRISYPNQGARGSQRKASSLDIVTAMIKGGHLPADWLVDEAMREAYAMGDMDTVHALGEIFDPAFKTQTEQGKKSETKVDAGKADEVASDESPLEGVETEDWNLFVESLKVEKPEFANERHVGQFFHSRDRLKQLGVSDVSTSEAQYQALVADVSDSRSRASKLINEYAGDAVSIGGSDHSITESGILGLIKSAGIRGAHEWLSREEDRKRFPRTTETFLKTNGVF